MNYELTTEIIRKDLDKIKTWLESIDAKTLKNGDLVLNAQFALKNTRTKLEILENLTNRIIKELKEVK